MTWTWGNVTEKIRGGLEEFIRVCNRRFKALEIALAGKQSDLGWFNVKDFGAVGDGLRDDTTAIRTTITAAGVDGTVYFPRGTYRVTGALTIASAGQRWLGTGRGASVLWKETTSDLITVSGVPWVEIENMGVVARTGVSTTYGTSGAAIRFTGASDDCTVRNLDVDDCDQGLRFDSDAGKRFQGLNLHLEPYTTTATLEGYIVHVAVADTGAVQRHFTNLVGSGKVKLVGALDTFISNGAVRTVEMDSNCQVCTFVNLRYGNLNNPIALDGGSNSWVNCAFSGTVTLNAGLQNSFVSGVLTGGAGLVNSSTSNTNAVFLWDGAQGAVQTVANLTAFRNQKDSDLELLLRAGSSAEQDERILFGDRASGTTHSITRNAAGQFSLVDVAAATTFLNQIPSSGNLQLSGAGSGGVQLNAVAGTDGVRFFDGALGQIAYIDAAGNAQFDGTGNFGGDVQFNQFEGLQFVVENRTSDPASPVTGQLWIRTDL